MQGPSLELSQGLGNPKLLGIRGKLGRTPRRMQTRDSSRAQFQSKGCLCNSHYIMSWVLIRQLLNEVFLPHPEGNSFGLSTCKHSLASENSVFDNRTPVFSLLCYKQVKDVKSRKVLQQFNLRTAEVSAV